VRFAVRADEPFGDIEDEVGSEIPEAIVGLFIGFDRENIVSLAERRADRLDGLV
jgi:hypothetical protein